MATAEQMREALQQILMLTELVSGRWRTRYKSNISPSSDSRTREKRISSDSGDDANEPWRRRGRYEGDRTTLHYERNLRQDFGEWTHRVRTLTLARFGEDILTALTWAAQQRKIVVKTCVSRK